MNLSYYFWLNNLVNRIYKYPNVELGKYYIAINDSVTQLLKIYSDLSVCNQLYLKKINTIS